MSDNHIFEGEPQESLDYDLIKEDLRILGIYYETMENFIDKEMEKRIEKEGGYDEYGLPPVGLHFWMFNFTTHLRLSFIMLLFSFFETKIDEICDIIAERKKLAIKRKELDGGIVATSKKYLKVFGGFNHDNIENWHIMEKLYDVRNIFVHGGGNISKSKLGSTKKVDKLLKMKIGLSKSKIGDDIYIADNEFCYFALKSMLSFFEQLKVEHLKNFASWRIIESE